jgi:hypothetical protein
MFFKTFAQKEIERKGRQYDGRVREQRLEIERLRGLVADDTGKWQDLWKCERAANDRLREALIQVRAVCEDNPSMATNFIDQVAQAALASA